jgi:pimeloyl-ACP methyl ester carboxylesterase
MKRRTFFILPIGLIAASGCRSTSVNHPAEQFGKTYYLDGAGHWGSGRSAVPRGLREAGYSGDVQVYNWTLSYNPLIDQLNIVGAKFRAAALAREIQEYHRRYPQNRINIVAHSAGTGVATWAVEQLEGDARIDNLVLLSSSLSHDYDFSKAIERIDGRVFVYYSPKDAVLQTVRLVGTIDGRRGVDSAGQVGLVKPKGMEHRVVNVAWAPEWTRLGWNGAHSDCAKPTFVKHEVARHILGRDVMLAGQKDVADQTQSVTAAE